MTQGPDLTHVLVEAGRSLRLALADLLVLRQGAATAPADVVRTTRDGPGG